MFQIKEYLKRLTAAYGVSGYESGAAEELKNILSGYCEDVSVDKMGNVIARLGCGLKNAKNVMLEAHMDQIGFIISKIEDDGKIRVKPIGGFDSGILPGLCVKIFGSKRGAEDSDLSGASGAVLDGAIMINASFKQGDKAPGFDDIYIETGHSKEELDKKLCIGDPAAFAGEAKELLGDNMSSKAMDNRAGAVAIINTLDMLSENRERLRHDLTVVFSTQEEIGLRGATTAAYGAAPDFAIAVDVTHGETPDSKDETGTFKLGGGAVVCRGPNLDYKRSLELIELAERLGIPYDIEVAGGSTGTTAWTIQTSGAGIPVALISIPLRYMHTNVETLNIKDIENTSKLICEAVCGGIEI